jgi:predicted site-specific integrase-resolvase
MHIDSRVFDAPAVMLQKDVAAELGISPRTLSRWLRDGYGPKAVRVGTNLIYDRAAVDAFVASSH